MLICLTEVIAIKGLVVLIIVAVAFLTLPLRACGASISVDGNPLAKEWDSAAVVNVIDRGEGSNCGVEYARLKAVISNEENAVYFLFMSMCDGLEKGNTLCGVSVDVESSGAVIACPGSNPLSIDTDKYDFTVASFVGDNESYYCEMRVGFKYGVPQRIPIAVRFIDAQGEPSTVYNHVIINGEYSQPDVTTIFLPATQPTEKTVTTKPAKTEKAVTTKEKTTREKRTAATTVQRTKKPAATTKQPTTRATAAPQVIVNMIMPTSKPSATSKAVPSALHSEETAHSTAQTQPASQTQYVLYTENTAELKRKRLTVSFAAVAALGGISALVMFSGRKGKSVSASTESEAESGGDNS